MREIKERKYVKFKHDVEVPKDNEKTYPPFYPLLHQTVSLINHLPHFFFYPSLLKTK